jgi:hypothetical protein
MLEKGITTQEIERTVLQGETIQEYNDDRPFPSRLVLSFIERRPIHVVVAQNPTTQECIIITCYEPDVLLWNIDFKSKR